ncbi:MAG TPA: helix-turn-helix domain-containing protein [Steroidobacteraceae bacterium]|nr:helix-turn-helix domain-containing protein [Steroidobacteraceae bacterium]
MVRKTITTITTDNDSLLGITASCAFLDRSPNSVRKYTDSGRLPSVRDSSGKRLIRLSDLKQFKRGLDPIAYRSSPVSVGTEVRDGG